MPSVGNFRQGMLVSIPLHLDELPGKPGLRDLELALDKHYRGAELISVVQRARRVKHRGSRPRTLNGRTGWSLCVRQSRPAPGRARCTARQPRQGRRGRRRAEHPADARARRRWRRKGSGARGGPRHSREDAGRGGDGDRRAGLVREAERRRHAGKQRRNANPHLRQHARRQQAGRADDALIVGRRRWATTCTSASTTTA